MRILIIEDDGDAAKFLCQGLTEAGHRADIASDGHTGLLMALDGGYEALIVDRMLPRRDGLTLIRMLRASGSTTPVLVLSALGQIDQRVEGLRAGGDDYLVKPYAFSELLARVEALTRRRSAGGGTTSDSLKVADLELDLQRRRATRAGRLIRLQPRELRLLEYLMRRAGRVVTRTMLLEQVWDLNFDPQTNVIDSQISRLRAKIDRGFDRPLLHTLRGVGYRLGDEP
ncbi:MAG: response regulator transcription factor [Steroidobacteraceae bacterium]|nr:response regulator transcription factor [Steroidobacteraceae bacterium]MDW8260018.1 response regulator transcription factor [Gammaproteobacteria bacterium]